MSERKPVLLAVAIQSANHRWHAAGIDDHGKAIPLICSEPGNLASYVGQPLDEQVSFLRHRLAGVLQRACDRLWSRDLKPNLIVVATDGPFPDASAELTQRVADHFVEWMTRPPVVFVLLGGGAAAEHQTVAGDWPADRRAAFELGWDDLAAARSNPQLWELVPTKR